MADGKSMGGPNTNAPGGGGMDYNGNPVGGAMGLQFQSGSAGPQMGFGMNPNNGMPFGSQPPVGIQGNQPADNNNYNIVQQAGNMLGGNVMGFGDQAMNSATQPPSLPTAGMGGGKGGIGNLVGGQAPQDTYNQYADALFGGGDSIYKPTFNARQGPYTPRPDLGPGVGFGVGLPQPQPIMNQPQMQQAIGNSLGMPNLTNQAVNRFAPPNAPGVRSQARGIPVQQARTVKPNQFTRTRAPRIR